MDRSKRNISRRELFTLGFFRVAENVESIVTHSYQKVLSMNTSLVSAPEEPKVRYVRPPGAIPEKNFLQKCTHCDDCIKACPHWVIRKAGHELGKNVFGTPIIIPEENPCLMCEDMPCIQSCKTGALLPIPIGTLPQIGTAIVEEEKCYQAQGQPCDYCMKHCPEKPKAIDATQIGVTPSVIAQNCTGCGKCAQICPTHTIWIKDRRER